MFVQCVTCESFWQRHGLTTTCQTQLTSSRSYCSSKLTATTCRGKLRILQYILINKCWLNGEVQCLLRVWDSAFQSGDAVAVTGARRNMEAVIKRAIYAMKLWTGVMHQCGINKGDGGKFWRRSHRSPSLFIGVVEIVTMFKYLALHISNNLTWATNTARIIRKAHQHPHFFEEGEESQPQLCVNYVYWFVVECADIFYHIVNYVQVTVIFL